MAGILRRLTGRGAPALPGEPPGTLELRGSGTRIVLVPELGGRITALEIGGREWLRPGGRLDECFPARPPFTAGPAAAGADETAERDETTAQRAEVRVETTPEGNVATSIWRGRRTPWRLERRVRVTPSGDVAMSYAASNESRTPLSYRWAAEALLPLSSGTRLLVTEGTPLRVADAQGIALGAPGAEHRWPHARLAKSIADLSRPARLARRYACRLFLQMKDGRLGVEEDGLRLELAFDPSVVPTLGLWLNHRGARLGEERAPDVLGVAPSSGPPVPLDGAQGEGGDARTLAPGARHEWTVTWSAHTVGPAPAR